MLREVVPELDFLAVHVYPEKGKVKQALDTLAGFAIGKPVLVEETFPLRCSTAEFEQFMDGSRKSASGWVGFYWGKPPQELRRSRKIGSSAASRTSSRADMPPAITATNGPRS